MTVLWIAAGGAMGAAARYGLGGWVQRIAGATFPWGTAAVNVLGSLLLGFAVVWLRGSSLPTDARLFLTVGVLGGFTTFSTLGYETVILMQENRWSAAALYALGSLALGVLGVLLGIAAADAMLGD